MNTRTFAYDTIVPRVYRALNLEGSARLEELADAFGTRHRSAFRFVRRYPESLAVVISQDGEVRFIVSQEGEIFIYEHEAALVVELVL